jgi:uncharacterized membrane protein (UPF0127 family)
MKKIATIKYKNKKIKIIAENCNFIRKITGLMFSRREKAKILLFNFGYKRKMAIHSFFVFYSFIALWLDEKNKVVEIEIVKPFTPYVSPRKNVLKLIEIPFNEGNKGIIKLLFPSGIRKI